MKGGERRMGGREDREAYLGSYGLQGRLGL